jgi:hypothetical protein
MNNGASANEMWYGDVLLMYIRSFESRQLQIWWQHQAWIASGELTQTGTVPRLRKGIVRKYVKVTIIRVSSL